MEKRTTRSLEWRRKHSLSMHRIISKLLKLKKMKERQFASEKTLKKRSQKLALTMLRKKVAGKAGGNYSAMSPAQKMAIDRLLSYVPQNTITQLSKRLAPVVRKHEQQRVKQARQAHKEEVEILERGPTHASARKASVATSRTKHRRHRRGAGAMKSFQRGGNDAAQNRTGSRAAVAAMMKSLHLKAGANPLSAITARQMAIKNTSSQSNVKRVRSWHKGNKKRALHGTRTNQAGRNQNRRITYHRDSSRLYQDYEMDMFADFLLEGNGQMDRFEQLYLRGLVPKNKIEITRRIFRDLDNNIRFRRYHSDISTMVERLIKLIVNDNTVYNKIKQEVQKGNHVNA